MARGILAALGLFVLAGCSPIVRSQVESFGAIPTEALAGRTLAVVAGEPEGLEGAHYREIIAARLVALGLVVVDEPTTADLLAEVSARIDGGRDREVVRSVPVYGYTYGWWPFEARYASDDRRLRHLPRYGIVGYERWAETVREYRRELDLRIVERVGDRPGPPVHESRVVSFGACGSLPAVFPSLVEALFTEWPAADGAVRTVDVAADLDC